MDKTNDAFQFSVDVDILTAKNAATGFRHRIKRNGENAEVYVVGTGGSETRVMTLSKETLRNLLTGLNKYLQIANVK